MGWLSDATLFQNRERLDTLTIAPRFRSESEYTYATFAR